MGGVTPIDEPTVLQRDEVMMMAVCGIPQETIAKIMRISINTLIKYYRHELDHGMELCNGKVAGSLYRKATSDTHPGAVTAAIFWLKVRNGWKEPPVTIDQTLQILDKRASDMTNDELVSLIARATEHLAGKAPDQEQLH